MTQINQGQYQFAKNLLLLLKETAKEEPNKDIQFQSLVTSSQLNQDYLQIANRISLTRNNNTNSLIQLLNSGKDTGKYGLRVEYLDDTGKSCQERLRIYIVELNKYLKEVNDLSSNIWETFRKIKNVTSSTLKGQNTGIRYYLNQLKSFKEDIQMNKYAVTKVGSLIKTQNAPGLASYKSEMLQKRQADRSLKQILEIKQKLLSIYNLSNPGYKKDIADTEVNHILESIKKHIQDLQSTKLQLQQFKKQQEKKLNAAKLQAQKKETQLGSSETTNRLLISCFVKVLQARKLQTLQQILRQIKNGTKSNQELFLKKSLQLYIKEYNDRKQQDSPVIHLKPQSTDNKKELILEKQKEQFKAKYENQLKNSQKLSKENQLLAKQIQSSKSEVQLLKNSLASISQNQEKWQAQFKRIEQQLQSQRAKFSYLDRSGVSLLSLQSQLINYQEVYQSPERRFDVQKAAGTPSETSDSKDIPSPNSENKTVVMLQCLKTYQQLQIRLKEQIESLQKQNRLLRSQALEVKEQFNQFFVQIEQYRKKLQVEAIKNYKLQTQLQTLMNDLRHQRQQSITNISTASQQRKKSQQLSEIQASHEKQIKSVLNQIEEYKVLNNVLQTQKSSYLLTNLKQVQKISSLEEVLRHFNIEKELYSSEILKKNSLVNQLQETIKSFDLEKTAYQTEINKLNNQVEYLKGSINELQSRHKEIKHVWSSKQSQLETYIQEFFISEQIYKRQLLEKGKQINQLLPLKGQLDQFKNSEKVYQHKIHQQQEKIINLKREIQQHQKEINEFKATKFEQIQLLESKVAILQTQIPELTQEPKASQMKQQSSQLSQLQRQSLLYEIVRLKQQAYFYRINSLFNGQILSQRPKERENLIQLMQNQTGNQIQRTKLVYKLDLHSTTSFHNYIDHLEGLLVIAETQKVVVAGFYQGIYHEAPLEKSGLIFSLTKNQCYELKGGKKAAVYDKFYFIIGNSEIRIKPDRKNTDFFSNFGVANSSFNAKGQAINDFLGQSDRNPKIVNFEIYQVIFAKASPPAAILDDATPN